MTTRQTMVAMGPLTPVPSAEEAVFALLNQTARSIHPELMNCLMDNIDAIVSAGKIYELSCNMDISAAKLSYETMSGKRFES